MGEYPGLPANRPSINEPLTKGEFSGWECSSLYGGCGKGKLFYWYTPWENESRQYRMKCDLCGYIHDEGIQLSDEKVGEIAKHNLERVCKCDPDYNGEPALCMECNGDLWPKWIVNDMRRKAGYA